VAKQPKQANGEIHEDQILNFLVNILTRAFTLGQLAHRGYLRAHRTERRLGDRRAHESWELRRARAFYLSNWGSLFVKREIFDIGTDGSLHFPSPKVEIHVVQRFTKPEILEVFINKFSINDGPDDIYFSDRFIIRERIGVKNDCIAKLSGL
jgi:hypothetical protein